MAGVAPLAGARIEIWSARLMKTNRLSPPSRGRELKYVLQPLGDALDVAPLAGARIEMSATRGPCRGTRSPPSRGRELKLDDILFNVM